ncbi:hypothetical protein ACWC5I_36735, partial [Kitasatospora sp. NPDC001574]
MPTMTIGSSSTTAAPGAVTAPGAVPDPPSAPHSSSASQSESAAGVGWSKTTVAGSRRPVSAPSRLRNSTEEKRVRQPAGVPLSPGLR